MNGPPGISQPLMVTVPFWVLVLVSRTVAAITDTTNAMGWSMSYPVNRVDLDAMKKLLEKKVLGLPGPNKIEQ